MWKKLIFISDSVYCCWGHSINQDRGGFEGINLDKSYSSSHLKGKSEEEPSCFRQELKGHTCASDSYVSIRTVLQVAF
jgi:hypothetical protein